MGGIWVFLERVKTATDNLNFTESRKRVEKAEGAVRLLWPLLKPYRHRMAGALVAVTVAAATVLALGWGLRTLVDHGFSDASGSYLDQALLVMLGVILLLAGASYVRFYLIHMVAERVIADLRKKIYKHLLSLDAAWFETHKTGEQVSRINTDTTVLQLVVTTNLPSAVRHFMMLLGGIAMLFVVSPAMTGLVLLAVPFVMGPVIYFGKKVRARSRDTQGRVGDIASFSHETLSGLQTVQSFGYEDTAAEKFGNLAEDTFHTAIRYVKVRAFLTAFVIAVVFGAIGAVLWAGGHKVLSGQISAGDLSAFIFYAVMVAGAVGALSEAMGAFNQATGAADRIVELLAQKPALQGSFSAKKPPETISGAVCFDNVSFRYPSRPDYPALGGVSFSIAPGEVAALVGPSGAGKTTIFQLLQRFYDPQSGGIKFDDFNIADFQARDIRRYLSVVSQDPAIFSVSVADNIRMGKPDATDEEVRRAAELAQAHDFIRQLPLGYGTPVGERGSRLSGGQKQRIAIARALLKNPKILLLDEATSSLDAANEQAVMLALGRLMKDRTTIVIAHSLRTVQNAGKIIVMDKGRVVAEGTHKQLFGKDSLYTHLAGLQLGADSRAG